jgi:hypothetical protein
VIWARFTPLRIAPHPFRATLLPTIHKEGSSKVTKEELFDNMLNTEQLKDLAEKNKNYRGKSHEQITKIHNRGKKKIVQYPFKKGAYA